MSDFLNYIQNYTENLWPSKGESLTPKKEAEDKPVFNFSEKPETAVKTDALKADAVKTFTMLDAKSSKDVKPENIQVKQNSVFSAPKAAEQKVVTAPEGLTNSKTTKKEETLDEYFSRYYTKYSKADETGKQKFVERYLKSLMSDEKQAKEFERLRQKGVKPQELERLAKVISKLRAGVQLDAADSVCNKGSEELNKVGRRVVANDYYNYDKKVQKDVSLMIVKTKDEEFIQAAAKVSYKTAKENQVEIVKNFFNTGFESVQKAIATNEGKYDKANQVSIYKTLMTSEHQTVLNEAAKNIYTLYKDNQVQATNLTLATKNEEAINAAASKAYLCDKSVQKDVTVALQSSGYKSVSQTLNNTENTNSYGETTLVFSSLTTKKADATKNESSVDTSSETTKTISDKATEIISSNSANAQQDLQDLLSKATPAERAELLTKVPDSMVSMVVTAILKNNPSMEDLYNISKIVGQGIFSAKEQKDFAKQLNEVYSPKYLTSSIDTFNQNMQCAILETTSAQNFSTIKRDKLSTLAKYIYDDKKTSNMG